MLSSTGKLTGKSAIITGGDSGIGRAVAIAFAREGADVSIVYLNEHEDARWTQERVQALGRRCLVLAGDIGDPAFCQEAVRQTIEALGTWISSSTTRPNSTRSPGWSASRKSTWNARFAPTCSATCT
jgi:NAD(P)-dependent dehydrogenase (short-subunit alcohol dehydrogenase family)